MFCAFVLHAFYLVISLPFKLIILQEIRFINFRWLKKHNCLKNNMFLNWGQFVLKWNVFNKIKLLMTHIPLK